MNFNNLRILYETTRHPNNIYTISENSYDANYIKTEIYKFMDKHMTKFSFIKLDNEDAKIVFLEKLLQSHGIFIITIEQVNTQFSGTSKNHMIILDIESISNDDIYLDYKKNFLYLHRQRMLKGILNEL